MNKPPFFRIWIRRAIREARFVPILNMPPDMALTRETFVELKLTGSDPIFSGHNIG
jgi:hypothetical protein